MLKTKHQIILTEISQIKSGVIAEKPSKEHFIPKKI